MFSSKQIVELLATEGGLHDGNVRTSASGHLPWPPCPPRSPDMAEFGGKRIVITGGAGGIGVETARTMLDHGAHVVLVDIDDDRLAKARDVLGTARIATWQSAIDSPAACVASLDSAGAPVAALIHLAGVFERDPFEANDHCVWDRAIAVNLTSA